MKYLLLALLTITINANATNTPKPKEVNINAQQQDQAQLQAQKQELINITKVINDVLVESKNNITNNVSPSSYVGDTSAYSGGNNFFAPPQVSFLSVPADTCGFSVTYTNDGGPYDAGKGGSLGCNASWGVGRDLKKAEASLLKAQESIIERDEIRKDLIHKLDIKLLCNQIHTAGIKTDENLCGNVEFVDANHSKDVRSAGEHLMREAGHRD